MNRCPSVDYARLSTMPRPNTEARCYLDRYQMAIERARLEKELDTLDTRRIQIQTRLQQLTLSLGTLVETSDDVQNLASASSSTPSDTSTQSSTSLDAYQTFVLEF